jgi:hypothetical protein
MTKPIRIKEEFPIDTFDIKLTYKNLKKEAITCWFCHKSHLKKYLMQHNIKEKDVTIEKCPIKP